MPPKRCPLNPKIFDQGGKMGLRLVKAIENHLSTGNNNCSHPQLKELVLKEPLNGTTPLLLACAQGNLVVVKRIIERWGVDVRSAATYYHPFECTDEYRKWYSRIGADSIFEPSFYDKRRKWHYGIEGATPLFVAAVNGHIHLVSYLVGKGADISAKTAPSWKNGGFTPLHGALNLMDDDGALRVVGSLREKKTSVALFLLKCGADPSALNCHKLPIWQSHLTDSNTTVIKALIHHGMSLEQRNPYHGDTILHHWVGNPLGMLFFEDRTEENSSLAVVKLLVEKGADLKALTNKAFTPLIEAANQFEMDTDQQTKIVDYLLEREDICLEEKIDAMELFGAVILSTSVDRMGTIEFEKALHYWRRALALRGAITKIPMKRRSGLPVEWVTLSQLDDILKHPKEWGIQSFLVKMRIYASKSWEAVDSFLEEFFEHGLPELEEQAQFTELINIFWAALEMIISFNHLGPVQRPTWSMTIEVTKHLVKILLNNRTLLKADTIKTSLELILAAEELHFLDDRYHWECTDHMGTLLQLLKMLAKLPKELIKQIKTPLSEFVRLEKRADDRGRSFLHLACKDFYANNRLATVRLLLKAGADANAGDSKGNAPLHILLSTYYRDETRDAVARLLLDCGAHLDRVNKKGKTAVDIWTEQDNKRKRFWEERVRPVDSNDLPDWCYENVPKLFCLSARVIQSRKIPYKEKLPAVLQKFVAMH